MREVFLVGFNWSASPDQSSVNQSRIAGMTPTHSHWVAYFWSVLGVMSMGRTGATPEGEPGRVRGAQGMGARAPVRGRIQPTPSARTRLEAARV